MPSKTRAEPHHEARLSIARPDALPDDFQAELDLTRLKAAGRIQHARLAGSDRTAAAEKRLVVDRRQEVRVVQYVKDLSTELDVEALRNPWDFVVLEQQEVEIRKTWPDQGVTPVIPKQVLAINHPAR